LSTPVFVCEVAVAEVAAVEEGVSLIAMAEAPRTVGGKVFTPHLSFSSHLLNNGRPL